MVTGHPNTKLVKLICVYFFNFLQYIHVYIVLTKRVGMQTKHLARTFNIFKNLVIRIYSSFYTLRSFTNNFTRWYNVTFFSSLPYMFMYVRTSFIYLYTAHFQQIYKIISFSRYIISGFYCSDSGAVCV